MSRPVPSSYHRAYGTVFDEDIQPLTAVNISTPVVLYPYAPLGDTYFALLFVLINNDATNPLTLDVYVSEDGVVPDSQYQWEAVAQPGQQVVIPVPNVQLPGPAVFPRYWQVSAHSPNPAYPVVAAKWGIAATRR